MVRPYSTCDSAGTLVFQVMVAEFGVVVEAKFEIVIDDPPGAGPGAGLVPLPAY